jgi:ribosomal protein L34E
MKKTCNKTVTPYLDKEANKVFCSECECEIENVTHFAKVQMQTLKQYRQKKTKSFSVKCASCNKEDRPKIDGKDIYCRFCNSAQNQLTPFFKNMLIEQLKKIDEES